MKSQSISETGRRVLGFAFALALVAASTPRAQSQTFSVIHNFAGTIDGANPLSGFVMDASGTLYGTTYNGGSNGAGVVFKYNSHGVTVLYNFVWGGTDGNYPEGSLIMDAAGNLYGTTTAGGIGNNGTVFTVTPKGKETVLYRFGGKPDGAVPEAGLVMDAAGNLYGTTTAGGPHGNGVVFTLVAPKTVGGPWKERVLYSFGTGSDGAIPIAGVTFDTSGKLYGTTSAGGLHGYGTVFQLRPAKTTWKERILYNFQEETDGGIPYAGVIFDATGHLYGATTDGGISGENGGGTIFKMTPSSSGWKFAVLYALPGWGISGSFRNLLLDASGNIYATTHCDGANSAGTVFRLTHPGGVWTYESYYVFTGGTDGLFSFSNLVADKEGHLYGTTFRGGTNGYGVIFKIKP